MNKQCEFRRAWNNNQCQLERGHKGFHEYMFRGKKVRFKKNAWKP